MSSVFPIFSEAQRRTEIAQALGGEVWWRGEWIFWIPDGHEVIIRVEDPGHHEDFDAEAWVERTKAEWAQRGVRL